MWASASTRAPLTRGWVEKAVGAGKARRPARSQLHRAFAGRDWDLWHRFACMPAAPSPPETGPFLFFPVTSRDICLFLIILLIAPALRAQSAADTVTPYQQPPVTVHATPLMPRSAATLGTVVRLEGWSIRRMDGRTLDAVLQEEGGLFVRDVGGPGGVKTVSLRNAPATQTVVQLNGLRLNHPQNSLVDLGLYPVALFDAVEVVRGGQSALFGAEANAGAVVLGIWPSMTDRWSIGGGMGSFGERAASFRWDANVGAVSTSVRGGTDRADGRFTFPWSDGAGTVTRTREGASYERWYAAASVVLPRTDGGHLEATVIGVTADRGSPGPVTAGPTIASRLKDRVGHGVVRYVAEGDDEIAWEAGISGSVMDETFEDPSIGLAPERYAARAAAGWVQSRFSIAEGIQVGLGTETSIASLESQNIASGARRSSAALIAHAQWLHAPSQARIMPMLRWDILSDQRAHLAPRLAVEVPLRADRTIVARASVGGGIRTPNFNERYWRPGGNPLLLPERVTTADAGLHYATEAAQGTTLALNGFIADTRDRITGWPPANLTRTLAWGVDANAALWLAGHRWWVNGTMAIVESRSPAVLGRQLPYVPRWLAATGIDLRFGNAIVSPTVRYVSRRFTTMDNSAALSLPPSARFSLAGQTMLLVFGVETVLTATADNIFDVSGISIPGYPLPGRSLSLRAMFVLPGSTS